MKLRDLRSLCLVPALWAPLATADIQPVDTAAWSTASFGGHPYAESGNIVLRFNCEIARFDLLAFQGARTGTEQAAAELRWGTTGRDQGSTPIDFEAVTPIHGGIAGQGSAVFPAGSFAEAISLSEFVSERVGFQVRSGGEVIFEEFHPLAGADKALQDVVLLCP